MTFPSDCPDQLIGENCTTTWKEELEPYSSIVSYSLSGYFSILAVITIYFLMKNKLYSFTEYKKEKRRMRRQSYVNSNVAFKRQLLFFVFFGAALMEIAHVVYFYFGMFLEFPVDTVEGKIAAFSFTFALSTAFCTAFCLSTVLQITIVAPIEGTFSALTTFATTATRAGESSLLDIKFLQAENMKGVFKFLGPFLLGCTLIIIPLFLDVYKSSIQLFRAFVGYLGWPLFLQGILVQRTGRNLFKVIDTVLSHQGLSEANIEKYETVRTKMKAYVSVMTALLYQNSVMIIIIGISPVAENIYIYFVIVVILGFSLAGVGTLIVYLFSESKPKRSTRRTNQSKESVNKLRTAGKLQTGPDGRKIAAVTKNNSFLLQEDMDQKVEL
eukprot:snap_masked-scaffold_15-processed-gene-5.32-mRNA-1 protein AED:1.00 eAED:1.00 QI:0/-1/0/0/-1/1/1/0/383